ncbi:hypothetical protein CFP65_6983 [Kitasatospora sp. MMS16-BH015]|uniref:glycoside hydrolase family 16 protein n=1 Tax=Kitasatospora sp. MMS16-BH015 TaxID=2018025 RepID=UPI000CA30014|nr:family 16 glycosylhydrolase [Kitasatospora sp. MMS16-BH015]AUG81595.1 hypothetical protein CFP65_6983 [Kitasatospora sp. MMS16-BH015]
MVRILPRTARAGALAAALLLVAAPAAHAAPAAAPAAPAAPPTVTQQSLTPTTALPDTPVAAQLVVKSSACFTAAVLGVGIRDAAGANLDFPGSLTNQQICPQGVTLTTGTRSFKAGTYRMFGFYQDQAGAWRNLPEQILTVAPPPPPPVPVVTLDQVSPADAAADTPVAAQLTLHASSCFTAAVVGVGVRDAADNNLDFPGGAASQQICPQEVTVKTGARSFPAGTYRMFGFYQDQAGAWHNLPERAFTVTPASAPDPTAPVPGKKLVWRDEFDGPITAVKWNQSISSAYRYGNYNPDDDKLDRIDPNGVSVADGVATFTARRSDFTLPSGRKAWDTGLITTENTVEKFMVKTGDYAETRVRMPKELGAWPALWTWHKGANEIDSFEYHPDNPHLLELTNHVRPAQKYWPDLTAVKPGEWVTIGTHYLADSVDWYVNGVRVFEDKKGVGANWTAYLILNLSLCSGDFHPAPSGTGPISFASDYVRVYR